MAKNSMYAIDRSEEYLAHYGIKGMKWGVRKAIADGGTGLGNRRLARQYRKAQKKLAKLERRANNGAKYARRAAALGAGAAAAGGLAAAGVGRVVQAANTVLGKGGKVMRTAGTALGAATPGAAATLSRLGLKRTASAVNTVGSKLGKGMREAGTAAGISAPRVGADIAKWGNTTHNIANLDNNYSRALQSHADRAMKAGSKLQRQGGIAGDFSKFTKGNQVVRRGQELAQRANDAKTHINLTNNQIARAGAAALGLGLAGAAGYNAYRAATTKRAAQKAAEFRKEMNQAFKGTAYANGGNGQPKKRRRR